MLIQWPDLTLKKKSIPVVDISKHADLMMEMKALVKMRQAWGVSAVQVGTMERFCAVRYGTEVIILVNPEITKRSPQTCHYNEGCLSISGGRETYLVERNKRVTVHYTTEDGLPMKLKGTGILASCLQHEIDHMDGITIMDRQQLVRKSP